MGLVDRGAGQGVHQLLEISGEGERSAGVLMQHVSSKWWSYLQLDVFRQVPSYLAAVVGWSLRVNFCGLSTNGSSY